MKLKYIMLIFAMSILLGGCQILFPSPTQSPSTAKPVTDTPSPYNTLVGITPNVITPTAAAATNAEQTASPSPAPTETLIPKPTIEPDISEIKQDMDEFMPPLDTVLRYTGIAETGHYGQMSLGYTNPSDAMYEFSGTYDDGMGVPDEFVIKYFFDYARGTVTEKAISNERLNKAEFNSKLHNIVVLKFPLSPDATWGHSTTINGESSWVTAQVIEYSESKVKVLYTTSDVSGYYNNEYIEIRTFEKGYGMTTFANILAGELDLSGVDTADENAVNDYIMNMYMFGYYLNK